ncbi:MAG: putative S-layer protein [Candidatus Staskawiczbacteria bacterium]|nr:putative S-layer protein [Candidatus Staskawiczbacteria bacterium]
MKFKIFTLFILSAFFLLSLASAALELKGINIPSSISPGQDLTISFSLTNTGTVDQTGLVWRGTPLTGPVQWKTLPSLTSIKANEKADLNAVISVPANTPPEVYQLTLRLTSSQNEAGSFPVRFNVNSSPTLSIAKVRELTRVQNGTVNVTNTGNVEFSSVTLSSTGNIPVTLSSNNFALAPGATKVVDVLASDFSGLRFGSNSITLSAKSGNTQTSTTFTIAQSFCKSSVISNNLSITDFDITNDGEGDDDTWMLLDKLKIEVEVENNMDEDIDDVFVELGLFDSQDRNMVNELDFENEDEEKFDLGDIGDGDEEVATFEFKVPADFDSGNYKLAVKAFSKKAGEALSCIDRSSSLSNDIYEAIEVEREDDEGKFIAFDNEVVSPSEAVCGDQVTLTADVYNVGEDEEDQVKVALVNKELGLDSSVEIRSDLDQGDKERVSFTFNIPNNAPAKTYTLELTAEYDYRNGLYREASDESFKIPLKVLSCPTPGITPGVQNAGISAELLSDAKAGSKMEIKATIKNLGNATSSFIVGVKGYESWADLDEISERILTLSPGQSKDVAITFDINEDASKEESFTIEVESAGKTESREVSVQIEKKGVPSLFQDRAFIWVLVAFNILLIILIIVVAVRLAKR